MGLVCTRRCPSDLDPLWELRGCRKKREKTGERVQEKEGFHKALKECHFVYTGQPGVTVDLS